MNKTADTSAKAGGLTEDENHKLHEEIQKLLKKYEQRVDEVQDKKTTEIMEI